MAVSTYPAWANTDSPALAMPPVLVIAPATVVLLLTVKVRALALDATKGCCC
jgi:hypothetical protein